MNDEIDYKILVNAAGQYSIWPERKAAPLGWSETGPSGTKPEVLEWIGEKWTDMRPEGGANALSSASAALAP